MDSSVIENLNNINKTPNDKDVILQLYRALPDAGQELNTLRESCFGILKDNPRNYLVRLLLARAYYIDGLYEFAVRELVELKNLSSCTAVDQLLDSFGEYAMAFRHGGASKMVAQDPMPDSLNVDSCKEEVENESNRVVAEVDFDIDIVDALEDLDKAED